jgi:hypothetical protein
MKPRDEGLIYLSAGPAAAVALGMVLVPLREFTTASNLAFPFVALTIAVAELAGRRAAVATALTSALSLDYFLTQPYMRFAIDQKHDVIAFVGLLACGLIAAAFGSERGRSIAAQHAAQDQVELMRDLLRSLEADGVTRQGLARVLDASRDALPLASAALRDGGGTLVAASGGGEALPVPKLTLRPGMLLPPGIADWDLPPDGLPLPIDGGRVSVVSGGREVGFLDLWGSGAPAGTASRLALCDVIRLVGVALARGADAPGAVLAGRR